MPEPPSRIPRATYRVQLHAGFTFDDAAAVVGYLADLGISHLYVSPVLQARAGSTHGYDVVDHGAVNDELGGAEGFARLSEALRANGMGLVLDIVPNHMAINDPRNRWWWDVLEHGRSSRWAGHFDVDWDPPESRLRNVILLPVLPDHYGRILEAGGFRIARRGGRFVVVHGELAFPLDPRTIGALVGAAAERVGSDELGFLGSALADLPPAATDDPELVARRQRDADVLLGRLDELVADRAVADALDAEVAVTNADTDALDALLEAQSYRLAYWRAASRDLGYRRFFDIDELVGLRMEDPDVFADTHRLVLEWVREGRVTGLRIDHPDGLRDPAGYLAQLRAAAPGTWIVAEKILEADESLPAGWPIDGTTGYGFATHATGLLVDASAEDAMDAHWASVADMGPGWEEIAVASRAQVLAELLGSDVNRLTDLLVGVCEANRRYRDFTRHELHEAIREVAAAMPVYRTYVRARDRHVSDADSSLVGQAVATATERRPDLDPELFAFLGRILRLETGGPLAAELAMRFQQLTPAAMAKGLEDTAFYRHLRLTALNEVGGDPGRFGVEVPRFHAAMADAAAHWPHAMLALTTHDTKRSADVRARLALISEDPDAWSATVAELTAAAAPHRSEGPMPSDADLELLAQTAVGAWPIDVDRLLSYLRKATKEAKLHTSWTSPNDAYDEAVERLVHGALTDPRYVGIVERVVGELCDAGRRASLAQVALQHTVPGVPDTYQGTEAWDGSLVDPDNRRPVDYDRLRGLLRAARTASSAEAWADRGGGLPKVWLVARLLDLRRRRADVLRDGGYGPLAPDGERADAAVAFARDDAIVAVVPRLVRRVERLGWGDTALELPAGQWRDLDGTTWTGRVRLADLLGTFPVSVLEREP